VNPDEKGLETREGSLLRCFPRRRSTARGRIDGAATLDLMMRKVLTKRELGGELVEEFEEGRWEHVLYLVCYD